MTAALRGKALQRAPGDNRTRAAGTYRLAAPQRAKRYLQQNSALVASSAAISAAA